MVNNLSALQQQVEDLAATGGGLGLYSDSNLLQAI